MHDFSDFRLLIKLARSLNDTVFCWYKKQCYSRPCCICFALFSPNIGWARTHPDPHSYYNPDYIFKPSSGKSKLPMPLWPPLLSRRTWGWYHPSANLPTSRLSCLVNPKKSSTPTLVHLWTWMLNWLLNPMPNTQICTLSGKRSANTTLSLWSTPSIFLRLWEWAPSWWLSTLNNPELRRSLCSSEFVSFHEYVHIFYVDHVKNPV